MILNGIERALSQHPQMLDHRMPQAIHQFHK